VITEYPIPSGPGTGVNASNPEQIIAGPGGMWFTEFGTALPGGGGTPGGLGKIAYDGTITEYPFTGDTPQQDLPEYLTLGPDGNIWWGEKGPSQRIGFLNPGSGAITHIPLPAYTCDPTHFDCGADQYRIPQGMLTGPDHNLWWVEMGANSVGR